MNSQTYRQTGRAVVRIAARRVHRAGLLLRLVASLVPALIDALNLLTQADARLGAVVGLSLKVSGTATIIGSALGLLLGAALAVSRFPGLGAVVAVLNTLLALPSVVVGLVIYLLLSRAGPLGSLGLLFTPTAMIVAQTVLVLPLVTAMSRRLVLQCLQDGGEQLRALGARPLLAGLLMLVHLRLGAVTVVLTAFGRAIAEVGAVMIVGGNIEGFTRVMTTSIALETSKGDLPLALGLGVVLLGVVGLLHGVMALLQWRSGAPMYEVA